MPTKLVVDCASGAETVAELDADELAAYSTDPTETQWDALRAERDARLVASDFTQLNDVGAAYSEAEQTAWATYRQELRDLPENTTDPANPVWPEPPPALGSE